MKTATTLALCALFLSAAAGAQLPSGAVIISSPGLKEPCGGFSYRNGYTVTPVPLDKVVAEKQRIRQEISAAGGFAWVDHAKPGQSYAIAVVTRRVNGCTFTTSMWEITSGKDAEARLVAKIKGDNKVVSFSVQESKVLL